MRRAAAQPETRLLGVVDDDGVLVGVLPIVRLAESVIGRVVPEALLADIDDVDDVARFGHAIEARTVGDVMIGRAAIRPDATIDEAFRIMHARHLSGLYVVDAGWPTDGLPRPARAGHPLSSRPSRPTRPPIGLAGVDQAVALTALVFVVTYALIATERIDKTIAALLGRHRRRRPRASSTRKRRSARSTSTSSSCWPG